VPTHTASLISVGFAQPLDCNSAQSVPTMDDVLSWITEDNTALSVRRIIGKGGFADVYEVRLLSECN